MLNVHLSSALALFAAASFLLSSTATAASPEELLNDKCGTCHAETDGGVDRIKDSRRTPEGWDMTLARMALMHGVEFEAGERAALVKHLADTRGLAPSETMPWRYILERRPGVVEQPEDDTIGATCARCHSYARIALQRRTEADWLKLAHFHLGQYPTTEYQAGGRDRNWWEIASTEVPPLLAEHYPLETDAWQNWQAREDPDLSGEWRIAGHAAGDGLYAGTMRVTAEEDDAYAVDMTLSYADGSTLSGRGRAILYTGYEWRGSVEVGGKTIHQVFAVDEDANTMSGRWFDQSNDVDGGHLRAVRRGPAIVAVMPEHLRAGETGEIVIHGVDLDGEVALGEGVEVLETVSSTANRITVKAKAGDDAPVGRRNVTVGEARAAKGLAVYHTVDRVRVEPANTIARVGGDGGPLQRVPAQFDAIAYASGADGEPGTGDDVRIGVWPATWSVEPATDAAAQLGDTEYAGAMNAEAGLFIPAEAGLNPERQYNTNNVGNLTVKALVEDQGNEVIGTAHLVVTVQRWNDPPIR